MSRADRADGGSPPDRPAAGHAMALFSPRGEKLEHRPRQANQGSAWLRPRFRFTAKRLRPRPAMGCAV